MAIYHTSLCRTRTGTGIPKTGSQSCIHSCKDLSFSKIDTCMICLIAFAEVSILNRADAENRKPSSGPELNACINNAFIQEVGLTNENDPHRKFARSIRVFSQSAKPTVTGGRCLYACSSIYCPLCHVCYADTQLSRQPLSNFHQK